jgi:hypothetical protein
MRAIKVTFRAVFRQPIGVLNPMGAKMSVPLPIELFPSGSQWVARDISANGNVRGAVYKKFGRFASLEHAKSTVEASFQERLQGWQMWGEGPNELTPYEVADLGEGKFGWIGDEDRTHIIHAQSVRADSKVPNAACGAQVNAKCFISTKANIEPTCRECKEVWEREYKDK